LRSEAFYVGALGSRKTHGRRVERLTEEGYSEDEIGKIHAPIGLAINAKSPAEIAISIMAQITQVLRTE
jgi:xanthine dehydrogenase accessory factor